jgi:hypothetical protein
MSHPEIEVYEDEPTSKPKQNKGQEGWHPDLNPTQKLIFDDPSQHVLGFGEKGSGKSIGFGHKIIRHCYENRNAFQLVITPSMFTGAEGIWQDLETLIIPDWVRGIGLDYRESRLDPQTKDKVIWIGNQHSGWSKMVLKSIPFAKFVAARIKGPAPSGVYVDEITDCEGPEYLRFPSAQLGRRRDIDGPQQFTASCNPKGPSHWVYKAFWTDCINTDTGERDPSFSVYHVPISENIHRLPAGYYERLKAIFSGDDIEMRRLMNGEWVDRPAGDAIFRDTFFEDQHVRPAPKLKITSHGIMPLPQFPMTIGYDPGPVNFSAHIMQLIPMGSRVVWTVIDELNYVGKRTPYHRVVYDIMERMSYWNERAGKQMVWEHISDEAAFSQINSRGSFDAQDIQQLSLEYIRRNPSCGLQPIRMKPCPKGPESIPARVRVVQGLLMEGCLMVSAICKKTREMFLNLVDEGKDKDGKYDANAGFRPKKGPHRHPFDSLSYPILFHHAMPGRRPIQTGELQARVFRMGV